LPISAPIDGWLTNWTESQHLTFGGRFVQRLAGVFSGLPIRVS
jgi:hypothetical protein